MAFAAAGEIGEAGNRSNRNSLCSEEPCFWFVIEAKHAGQAGHETAQPEINSAVGFKADLIHNSTGIVRTEAGDGFRSSADQSAYSRLLITTPEKRRYAKERGGHGVVDDCVRFGADHLGHFVGGEFGG